jgi:hypothetical protein
MSFHLSAMIKGHALRHVPLLFSLQCTLPSRPVLELTFDAAFDIYSVGGVTTTQPPSTPVPEKPRDALFIERLHAEPSPMEPTA